MSKSDAIKELYKQYVMPTYAQSLTLVKGNGTKVWDADGKVYLDFMAGISVLNVGHCHPKVVEAVRKQVAQATHFSNLYFNGNQARLAERLARLGLGGKCFFGNSGAEANEGLIKLARLWGHEKGRHEIITMKNSFHGRTLATAAATGQDKIQKGFEPLPVGFVYAEFNNLESVRALVNDKTVAVLLEAIQGEGGIVPADEAFMLGVRALCDEKDLLMLCDEVQCGMGRTGHWFGYQNCAGVKPDAFSLAKALGSGYPIGAVVSNAKLADVFQPGNHASTFGGAPLACAAALATIDAIEEEHLLDRARTVGKQFADEMRKFILKYEHVKEVRGKGLMLGLALDQSAKPLASLLIENGLLTLATAETVCRFLPPLNVKDEEIEEALEILDDCLAQWHGLGQKEEEESAQEEAPEQAAETPAAAAWAETSETKPADEAAAAAPTEPDAAP
ncbi:MAG: aspartate aminotransferase family protein [Verrucomicrobiota bacterium]|nr:aspartate aminotransferase family protein [Verrucomicrobiota bacterium]